LIHFKRKKQKKKPGRKEGKKKIEEEKGRTKAEHRERPREKKTKRQITEKRRKEKQRDCRKRTTQKSVKINPTSVFHLLNSFIIPKAVGKRKQTVSTEAKESGREGCEQTKGTVLPPSPPSLENR
jgi:hypothetical protein